MNSYLDIPDPCHEDWGKMSVTEKGRFCGSCQIVVRDLRDHTYDEMVTEFRQSGGEICASVNTKELRKGYVDQRLRQLRAEQVRHFFLAILLSFGVSLFSITKTSAVNALKEIRSALVQAQEDTMVITGVVTDKETKETLPFVNILLYSGDSLISATTTDLDGNYKIRVLLNNYAGLVLKTSYIGYSNLEVRNIPLKRELTVNVEMKQVALGMIEGVIIFEPQEDPHKLDGSGKTFRRKDIRRMPK